jgi:DnaJ-class molecular chaperone
MRDPYEVLSVGRSASEAEVKKAYRKLAKQYHPDRHSGDKRAQSKFAEINSAYEIVGDKEKRGKFDRGEIDADGKPKFQGFEGFRGGPGGGFSGFENVDPSAFGDIFEALRRSQAGGGQGGPGGGTRPFRFSTGPGGRTFASGGEDDDILSSIFGGLGGGRARARQQAPTHGADARGEIAVTLEDIANGVKPKVALPTGKTVALTLPQGVEDGQVIRLAGQGQPSPSGGRPGDALVTVRFVPHPLFKPEGADLRLDLPISLDEAVLGAKIPVPTLSGKVQVTIPPGSSSGRTLRLKGKGLPKAAGDHGDLLVTPRIVLPEGTDGDLETLMKNWRVKGKKGVRGTAFE